jgi:hypothetical protein
VSDTEAADLARSVRQIWMSALELLDATNEGTDRERHGAMRDAVRLLYEAEGKLLEAGR